MSVDCRFLRRCCRPTRATTTKVRGGEPPYCAVNRMTAAALIVTHSVVSARATAGSLEQAVPRGRRDNRSFDDTPLQIKRTPFPQDDIPRLVRARVAFPTFHQKTTNKTVVSGGIDSLWGIQRSLWHTICRYEKARSIRRQPEVSPHCAGTRCVGTAEVSTCCRAGTNTWMPIAYWNGPDEALAVKDEVLYRGIDALTAYWEGRLNQQEYLRVMRATKERLSAAGIEDLNLRGNHVLLSVDASERLATDSQTHHLSGSAISSYSVEVNISRARDCPAMKVSHVLRRPS